MYSACMRTRWVWGWIFPETSKFTGASGSAANAGEVGSLSSRQSQGGAGGGGDRGGGGVGRTAPLVLRVPVGTLVRRKRSATLLADLTRHGQVSHSLH